MAGPGVGDQAGRNKWKARLGPELDGEKLWRDQVLGTRLGETSGRLVWGQN